MHSEYPCPYCLDSTIDILLYVTLLPICSFYLFIQPSIHLIFYMHFRSIFYWREVQSKKFTDYCLRPGVGKLDLQAESSPMSVLLEHSHPHSFTHCLSPLLLYDDRVVLTKTICGPQILKYLLSSSLQKKFPKLCSRL